MKIAATTSTRASEHDAVNEAYGELIDELGAPPDFMVLGSTVGYDFDKLRDSLTQIAPGVPTHGLSSSQGVMTHQGFACEDGKGLALWGLSDPRGTYGVASAHIGDSPRQAGTNAVTDALERAGRPGESPQIIWLTAAPGSEEAIIEGIQDVIGPNIPIIGGSSADDAIDGSWRQLANDKVFQDAVVVSTLYPSTTPVFAFHSGYEPTSNTGIATEVDGRVLVSIDDRPASEVYDEWSGGRLDDIAAPSSGPVLVAPLGRTIDIDDGRTGYVLSHPLSVTTDGGLRLFTDVHQGERLSLMKGTLESLIERAGRTTGSAMEIHGVDKVIGGLVVYCAGCLTAIGDRRDEMIHTINDALGDGPFMGIFTFGEQGCFLGSHNRHGNLMISVLLFPETESRL